MSSTCDSCPSNIWIVPGSWHIWGMSGNRTNTTRASSTSPNGTWSWKRLLSKSTSRQPECSYTSPLISTTIGSLEKYQLGSSTPASQTERHDMNITCGQQQGWLEEGEVDTATGWLEVGVHGEQDTTTHAPNVTAGSTWQKSAHNHTSGVLLRNARCRVHMHGTSHVTVYALTSHCILVAIAWTCKRRLMHSRTSYTSMIMKTERTSCVEATILGREWCYAWSLVCSECLNGSVAGTIRIGIAGCHFWNPVLLLM
jgi:hypothetical protein